MRRLIILLLASVITATAQTPPTLHNYEFTNGNWFDGQKFVARTFYSVGGMLTSKRPARVDRVFDLSGKYVVPPFGEAHNHNLDRSSDERFAKVIKMYLDDGIFYVKNPNSLLRSKEPTSARINLPNSVDGVLSNGGLTGSGGHLKMWCETTAFTIFPKRKIGYLKDGYEANFLVLTANPLIDFANVKTIDLRIKRGELLEP